LSGSAATNYQLTATTATATASITLRQLTVTAQDVTVSATATIPVFTFSYTGLAPGDSSASFSGALSYSGGHTAGTHTIILNTLAATGNYTIGSYISGQLTIQAALAQPGPTVEQASAASILPTSVLQVQQQPILNVNSDISCQSGSVMNVYRNRPVGAACSH